MSIFNGLPKCRLRPNLRFPFLPSVYLPGRKSLWGRTGSRAPLRVGGPALGLQLLLLLACSDSSTGPSSGPEDGGSIPGPDPIPEEIVNWLKANAHPFATPEAGSGFDDLQFLKAMIGDASVVSLGEATHGTREFFQMKHRVLEFLVEELDFNLFAIEATWPEANRLNDYVHTGEGDPVALLSGLYFWTWNTQEVLDMIEWMRAHNENPGDDPTVSFLGFDLQFPGMAIHNVLEFFSTVDPQAEAEVSALYGCMLPFANGPRGFASGQARYGDQSATYRNACLVDLLAVQELLRARQVDYEAASTKAEFSQADRSARLVIQFEDMRSGRTSGARDAYMAENAIWLHDEGGPGSKIVLWAHNGHVANDPDYAFGGSMGRHLRRHYSDDMVIVGFDFYQGGFRAVTGLGDGIFTRLEDHSVGAPPEGSYEYYFNAAGMDRMVLDLRSVDLYTPATSWLAGPRLMRRIGSVYQPTNPNAYLSPVSITAKYDLIVYFHETAAAVGLPYNPPASW